MTYRDEAGGTKASATVKPVIVTELVDLDTLLVRRRMRHELCHHRRFGRPFRDGRCKITEQVWREFEMLLEGKFGLRQPDDSKGRHLIDGVVACVVKMTSAVIFLGRRRTLKWRQAGRRQARRGRLGVVAKVKEISRVKEKVTSKKRKINPMSQPVQGAIRFRTEWPGGRREKACVLRSGSEFLTRRDSKRRTAAENASRQVERTAPGERLPQDAQARRRR